MYTVKTLNKLLNRPDRLDKTTLSRMTCRESDAIIVRSADMHNYEINPALLCAVRRCGL